MSRNVVSEIKKDHIYRLTDQGRRGDDRKFDERRKVQIELGLIETAEGSARVNLGGTDVIVGVKIGMGEPFSDRPAEGVLTTNAELVPIAYHGFESGPPREEAIELARVVDRGIRESKSVDLEKLCITPEEEVWILFIDIHVIDYNGNLFDAATLGAISALANTNIPASRFEKGDDFPIPVEHFPIATTIVKLGDNLLVDPDIDEELVSSTRLTVVTDENGDIRAMQKGNGGNFTVAELKKAIQMAQKVNTETRESFNFLH